MNKNTQVLLTVLLLGLPLVAVYYFFSRNQFDGGFPFAKVAIAAVVGIGAYFLMQRFQRGR